MARWLKLSIPDSEPKTAILIGQQRIRAKKYFKKI